MKKHVFNRVRHRIMKLRLQPIHVYCLHHVSAVYEAESMNACDWLNIDTFKVKIINMQKIGVEFISLKEAYEHIKYDFVRSRKYAVITFDDGYASLKEILPWLEEQKIPTTLFINGKYLDGKSYRRNPKERYLIKDELFALTSPFLEIASHGWEHMDASQMTIDEFSQYIDSNVDLLQTHPRYISFHAYTWGKHTADADVYLLSKKITPVYIDGMKNYNELNVIHRELL